jgi:hypothetical protein
MSDFAKMWAAITALNDSFYDDELNAIPQAGILALMADLEAIATEEDTTFMEAGHILRARIRPASLDTYALTLTARPRK